MIDILLISCAVIFLLVVDLMAIAVRAAYSQANQARLLGMRDQMEKKVNRTLSYLPLVPRVRASMNLILVLTRVLLTGLVLFLIANSVFTLSTYAVAGLLILCAIILFIFEWTLERFALRSPEIWAAQLGFFVRLFISPLSFLMIPFGRSSHTAFDQEILAYVTEDDLKSLVDAGEEEGVFEQEERRMIYSIFQLGDTLVREIMVPRIDILTLDVNTPLLEAVDAFLQSGHSRVPVFEETVDNTLGLLYAKDLLQVWRKGDQLNSLRELLRPAYFVPEAKKVDELLAEMQSQRIHMAVVVDEYGGIAGLVTLEDIVEEIFGEIQDEYDQAEESPYQITQDGEYLFSGRIDLDDFNDIMGSNLPTDDADTLGGYIYSRLGHVPSTGEEVQDGEISLIVDQVSARRIRTVRASRVFIEGEAEGI